MAKNYEDMNFTARFRNFNWEKSRSFYIIAKLGSFSKAGSFLRISQSGLSRQVMDLENTLGTALFIREQRGVRLTRKGKELYSIIEPTFLGLSDFTRKTYAQANGDKKRKIRICTTHAIATYILSEYIFAYNQEHPHLIFELVTDDHMIDVVLNDVDIAIRPFDSQASGIQQEHLFTLEKKLYASSKYLEKYGEPQTVEELKDHHIIAHAHRDEHPYSDLNWILRLGMVENKIREPVFSSTSIEASIECAKEGIGIIGCYEEMTIIKNSGLKNILSETKDKLVKWYFIYPDHLKNDTEINELRNYFLSKFK